MNPLDWAWLVVLVVALVVFVREWRKDDGREPGNMECEWCGRETNELKRLPEGSTTGEGDYLCPTCYLYGVPEED
jgi:hypothetical protein